MDIEKLRDTYIVLAAKGASELESYAELRLLDNEIDKGVQAVYDDEGETIVAFAFSRAGYTEETAQTWITEAEKEGVNLEIRAGLPGQAISTAVEELTFDDVSGLLREALEEAQVTDANGMYRWPWLIDVYRDYCVIGLGARYYRVPYVIDDANIVTFGALQEVAKTYVPVEPEQIAADTSQTGTPRVLSFRLREPSQLPAQASDDDGLVWKEIFQVSTTFRPFSGHALVVTESMIAALEESFIGGALNQVPIAASDHYEEEGGIVPASDTVGFVEKVVKSGPGLFAGLDMRDAATKTKLDDGLIRDCSVFIWSDWHDQREPDKTWDWVLMHLLLTNYPQLPDLGGFGVGPAAIAASMSGVNFERYTEDRMSEQTETPAGQGTEITAAQRQRLTELQAFEDAGFTLAGAVEQAQAVRQSMRDLEIESITAALDGRSERDDVTTIEGMRHYPAVVEAARAALAADTGNISADMTETGGMPVDTLVLSIVNALPAEARIAVGQAPQRPARGNGDAGAAERTHRTVQIDASIVDEISDDQLDEFLARIGHRVEKRDAGE